jgi:secreted trypsin-like serine protease
VRLGEHTISKKRDCQVKSDGSRFCADPVQDIPLSANDITPHPNYDHFRKFNDIALIRLQHRAKIHQNNIKPICLPFDESLSLPNKLIVIGTGSTLNQSSSDVLQWVQVDLVKNDRCKELFSSVRSFELTDKQMCAGDHRDSCGGDSGSSLFQYLNVNGDIQAYQFGVVSFGKVMCGNNAPGVYARVSSYVDWILDVVEA